MNIRFKPIIPLTLALTLTAGLATAQIPSLDMSWAETASPGAVLYVTWDGEFASTFDTAFDGFGNFVDATITLHLRDADGFGVVNFPREDIWLETTAGGLFACPGGAHPDDNTNLAGDTSWTGTVYGVGCSIGEGTQIYVAGSPLNQAPLDISFISADLSSDGDLNLTDVTLFTQIFFGAYNACNDAFHDGVINLADLTFFTYAYFGGTCAP